jgi:hypothetical protein
MLGRFTRMATTLTVCSWLLAALGAGVTVWLCPHPLMFLPYVFLGLGIRAARRIATRAFVLILTLASASVGFWYCWDAAFIHLSTLNLTPLVVVVVEAVVAGATWLVVRRIEKDTHAHNAA